jgi:hypothetical protein
MPLKRVTPSLTVEYRQAKRPNTGSAKLGWAHAQPAPEVAQKGSRVAISAFKTADGHSSAKVILPSIARGRILPTLPVSGQVDAERTESRSEGRAAKARHATQVTGHGTVARQLGEHTSSAEDLKPLVTAVATIPPVRPTPSDASATKAKTSKSEKRIRRPAEKHAMLDHDFNGSADMSETAPTGSTSGLEPVDKPSSATRTSRILDRYVFRAERGPGESWKRRIEARRERRA